jgi:hypothetical protein
VKSGGGCSLATMPSRMDWTWTTLISLAGYVYTRRRRRTASVGT